MLIIPAIDIRNGNCVRLYQGRADQETIYSRDPVDMARAWISHGATYLHIADLDGAFHGKPVNLHFVSKMKQELKIPIQVGGGFRDLASIELALQAGVDKVIIGTAAVYNPELVYAAVKRFGKAIAVSIDVSDDYVAVAGWKELSAVRFDDLAIRMRDNGIKELLFTDTRKDGTLSGPNISGIQLFLKAAQVPVTVSGGISSLDDIHALKEFEPEGLQAVVVGKALYDHRIKLEDAIRVAQSPL
jgi:phosphoribosylformimino-5-aminoimidazole carboxamide ribotide isomerase